MMTVLLTLDSPWFLNDDEEGALDVDKDFEEYLLAGSGSEGYNTV